MEANTEQTILFRNTFRGRSDVVARHFVNSTGDEGYMPIRNNGNYLPLSSEMLRSHFVGTHIIGIYPIVDNSLCYFLAADFDNHSGGNHPLADVIEYYSACRNANIPTYILRSKSGNGYHAFIFFTESVPARKARLVGSAILREAGIDPQDSSFDRFFPSQDETNSLGNLIALPFQGQASENGHTLFLNPQGNFTEPYSDQWEILAGIQKINEIFLDNLITEWGLESNRSACANSGNREHGWVGRALNGVGEGERNTTTAALTGYYINRGLRENEIADILSMWNMRNRPPMSQNELLQTIASIQATHERQNQNDSFGFPTDIMSGLAGEFACLYSAHLESPIQFFFMSFLCCLGTALADRITLDIETFPQPRFFLVLLGQSADERKSTAINKTIELFEQAFSDDSERNWRFPVFNICRGAGSAEGLQKRLEARSKVLFCLDEMKQFASKCKIDSSVLLPCVNTLFESNVYENITSKSRISIENAYLSIIGASTTDTWETLWNSAFINIGFTNRIFLTPGVGQRLHAFPGRIPDEEKNQIILRLRHTVQSYPILVRFDIDADARELFERWYLELPSSMHTKRLDTYAHRFLPLLAVNDGKDTIDEETVQKAISLCNWQLRVRQLHDPIDADSKMAAMEERIRRSLISGPKTGSQLKRDVNYSRVGIWFYENALRNLQRIGEIRNTGNNRRPRWAIV
jgi:hypothetical protein